jgi:hypothetical protein
MSLRVNTLGDSTLRVSELCLGTMTFGQQNTLEEAHAQLLTLRLERENARRDARVQLRHTEAPSQPHPRSVHCRHTPD